MSGTQSQNSQSLFVFVDESGNFDFSTRGTKHFVMAATMTTNPDSSAVLLQELKYDLIRRGLDLSDFRASRDLRRVRDEVFRTIARSNSLMSHVIFGRKDSVFENCGSGAQMYREFALEVGKRVVRQIEEIGIDEAIMIFDQTITGGHRETLRRDLSSLFESRALHLTVMFHPLNTDFNGQITDYIAWAKFRELERSDIESWTLISNSLNLTLQDLFDE